MRDDNDALRPLVELRGLAVRGGGSRVWSGLAWKQSAKVPVILPKCIKKGIQIRHENLSNRAVLSSAIIIMYCSGTYCTIPVQ